MWMRLPYVTEKAGYRSPEDCQPMMPREFARHHYMSLDAATLNMEAPLVKLFSVSLSKFSGCAGFHSYPHSNHVAVSGSSPPTLTLSSKLRFCRYPQKYSRHKKEDANLVSEAKGFERKFNSSGSL